MSDSAPKTDDWPCPLHDVSESDPSCPACCLALAEGLALLSEIPVRRLPLADVRRMYPHPDDITDPQAGFAPGEEPHP